MRRRLARLPTDLGHTADLIDRAPGQTLDWIDRLRLRCRVARLRPCPRGSGCAVYGRGEGPTRKRSKTRRQVCICQTGCGYRFGYATASVAVVAAFRIGEAAELLGVSPDTVRRWVDGGRLAAARDEHGHRVIAGVGLAAFARSLAGDPDERGESSARNRLRGIVTAVVKDTVMAQVDIQAGPFRVVSLLSREAADELDLQVGSVAVAVIKSTTVVVEKP